MPEIQEQVERLHAFLDKYRPALPKVPNDLDWYHLQEDVRALLRQFMEECCKAECQWCAGVGCREKTNQEVCPAQKQGDTYIHYLIWDLSEPEDSKRAVPCEAHKIRQRFPWLIAG